MSLKTLFDSKMWGIVIGVAGVTSSGCALEDASSDAPVWNESERAAMVETGALMLMIDGQPVGLVEPVGASLATINHEPLIVEVSMGMGQPMWEWIRASFEQGHATRSVELLAADFNHKAQVVREFSDAYLSEVSFPSTDGSSEEAGAMTVTLTDSESAGAGEGGRVRSVGPGAVSPSLGMVLGGLPTQSIEKLRWRHDVVEDEQGEVLSVPNLRLGISEADLEPWAAWHKSFVIDGNCADSDELTGSIQFSSPDLSEELGTIQLRHVGLVALEQGAVEANKEEVARVTVELYVESMFFEY